MSYVVALYGTNSTLNVTSQVAENLTLVCEGDSRTDELTWIRNGSVIDLDTIKEKDKYNIIINTTLNVSTSQLTVTGVGQYACLEIKLTKCG